MANEPRPDATQFNRPRTWGGLGLLALVVGLYIADVFHAEFKVDSVQLGLLLGTALLMLGVEAGKRLIR